MPKKPTDNWRNVSPDQLFTIPELDETPLRPIPRRTRYALIASGALGSVEVGDRRYVTKTAITDFIDRHAKKAAG